MVYIFERVPGFQPDGREGRGNTVEAVVARHADVQRKLDEVAVERALMAEMILTAHRHAGHSQIKVERGSRSDRFVVLDDTRGLLAALTIEFGRHRDRNSKGEPQSTSEGVWALHDAFGLPHKAYGGGGDAD